MPRYILTTSKEIPLIDVAEALERYGVNRTDANVYLIGSGNYRKLEIISTQTLPTNLIEELEKDFKVTMEEL